MIRVSFFPSLVILALLTVGLVGCDAGDDANVVGYNPGDNLIQGNTNQSVRPVLDTANNRLVFRDQEHFTDFMQEMSEIYTTYEKLDSLESELGFRSLRGYINDLIENLDESPIDDSLTYFKEYNKIEALDIVEDPLFATVLNANGEIQIEETIHRIGKFFVHSVDKNHEYLLQGIDNNSNVEFKKDERMDVFRIERHSNLPGLSKYGGMASSSCSNKYNSNKYKVTGRSWITTYNVYGSAGVETKHYKRTAFWGRYRLRSVHKISITFSAQLYNSGNYHSYTNHLQEAFNVNTTNFTFSPGGISNGGIHGYIDAYHHVERADNGNTAGCATFVSQSA